MFSKTILFLSSLSSLLLGPRSCIGSQGDRVSGNYENIHRVERDGLYDPHILSIYNNAQNVEQLYLTEKYQTYYFSKLDRNKGDNTKGSCGFVATGMLLSFWDTYWDDDIVEEKYEAKTTLGDGYINLFAESPGIIQEPEELAKANNDKYFEYIPIEADNYFHFKLTDLFQKNVRAIGPNGYGLEYGDYVNFYRYYAYVYLGYSTDDVEIICSYLNVRNQTIDLIKRGIPVKLGIGSSDMEHHAVVAYDYDEAIDSIYCNFGWGSNATHVTIESMGYTQYTNIVAFDFKNAHHHSDNYFYVNEYGENESLCSCRSTLPSNLRISKNNYLDKCPTYEWDSLIHERWHRDLTLRFYVRILDKDHQELVRISDVNESKYTLSRGQWDIALSAPGNSYCIYIGLESSINPYWDGCYCLCEFLEPKDFDIKAQIKPSDWGFEGRYWFSNEGDNGEEYKETILSVKGLTIIARRLRCGYIENQYINLSPRRQGAGEAYLMLTWDKPVYSYMFGASFWSNGEILNGAAYVSVKHSPLDENSWSSEADADFNLKEIGLSTTRANIKRFAAKHVVPIYGVKFYASADAVGDRNKGRICLDDIVLNQNPLVLDFISTGYSSIG
ncbi:MAG: hypothetical protein ACI32C_01295 [Candidatus Enteromonas sp.]